LIINKRNNILLIINSIQVLKSLASRAYTNTFNNPPKRVKWLVILTKLMGLTPIHRKTLDQIWDDTVQVKKIWLISSNSLRQKTQHLSNVFVIIPLLYKASFVGSFSSNNLHPKILTFDGTLFNQRSLNTCTGCGPINGELREEIKAKYADFTVKIPAACAVQRYRSTSSPSLGVLLSYIVWFIFFNMFCYNIFFAVGNRDSGFELQYEISTIIHH
jgi:hypothetical protein